MPLRLLYLSLKALLRVTLRSIKALTCSSRKTLRWTQNRYRGDKCVKRALVRVDGTLVAMFLQQRAIHTQVSSSCPSLLFLYASRSEIL